MAVFVKSSGIIGMIELIGKTVDLDRIDFRAARSLKAGVSGEAADQRDAAVFQRKDPVFVFQQDDTALGGFLRDLLSLFKRDRTVLRALLVWCTISSSTLRAR